MSDEDQPGDEIPEADKQAHYNKYPERPDLTGEPIRAGYRLDEDTGILYGVDGKPRCSAKARNAPAGVCHGWPVKRQKRCRMHGGTSPLAKQRAERERVDEDMRTLLANLDMGPVQDPLTALKAMAGEVVAWKDAMRSKVEELNTLSYSTDYGETAKAVVQLFERALDRAGDFLFKIARLNIDERLAAVEESMAKKIEAAFFAGLDEIGIPLTDMDTREKAAIAFAKNLSVVPDSA